MTIRAGSALAYHDSLESGRRVEREREGMESRAPVSVAILGEHNREAETHRATDAALVHSALALDVALEPHWISSAEVDATILSDIDGILIAPGPPHTSVQRTLEAIRFGREKMVPTLGTCGGFQLIILELARHLLAMPDAAHAEYDPDSPTAVITPSVCSLRGQRLPIRIEPDSLAGTLYGTSSAEEMYYCSYGINPMFVESLQAAPLRISGEDDDGEIRIIELINHPFFLGTLFVPQALSLPDQPHPVITGFVQACRLYADRAR